MRFRPRRATGERADAGRLVAAAARSATGIVGVGHGVTSKRGCPPLRRGEERECERRGSPVSRSRDASRRPMPGRPRQTRESVASARSAGAVGARRSRSAGSSRQRSSSGATPRAALAMPPTEPVAREGIADAASTPRRHRPRPTAEVPRPRTLRSLPRRSPLRRTRRSRSRYRTAPPDRRSGAAAAASRACHGRQVVRARGSDFEWTGRHGESEGERVRCVRPMGARAGHALLSSRATGAGSCARFSSSAERRSVRVAERACAGVSGVVPRQPARRRSRERPSWAFVCCIDSHRYVSRKKGDALRAAP